MKRGGGGGGREGVIRKEVESREVGERSGRWMNEEGERQGR